MRTQTQISKRIEMLYKTMHQFYFADLWSPNTGTLKKPLTLLKFFFSCQILKKPFKLDLSRKVNITQQIAALFVQGKVQVNKKIWRRRKNEAVVL